MARMRRSTSTTSASEVPDFSTMIIAVSFAKKEAAGAAASSRSAPRAPSARGSCRIRSEPWTDSGEHVKEEVEPGSRLAVHEWAALYGHRTARVKGFPTEV